MNHSGGLSEQSHHQTLVNPQQIFHQNSYSQPNQQNQFSAQKDQKIEPEDSAPESTQKQSQVVNFEEQDLEDEINFDRMKRNNRWRSSKIISEDENIKDMQLAHLILSGAYDEAKLEGKEFDMKQQEENSENLSQQKDANENMEDAISEHQGFKMEEEQCQLAQLTPMMRSIIQDVLWEKDLRRKNRVPYGKRKANLSSVSDPTEHEISQVKDKIKSYFPNFQLGIVVSALYQNMMNKSVKSENLQKSQILKKEKPKPVYPTIIVEKKKAYVDLKEYNYLKIQMFPPLSEGIIPKYGENGSNFYDVVIVDDSERTKMDEFRLIEQRLMAEVFCRSGYGISEYRTILTDKTYDMPKERYKSVIGTMIRLGFRNIEEFLHTRMKRNISALRRIEVKALLTPLLNIKGQFSAQQISTFHRCLRTNFKLDTELATDIEVLNFYKAVVAKTRGPEFVEIVSRPLSSEELKRIEYKMHQQKAIWTAEVETSFIEAYLKKQTLSGVKEQLEIKYPHISNEHFEHAKLRARCDKVFTILMKRMNIFLDRAGKSDHLIFISDGLKKVMSRSPIAMEIRLDLCKIYLNINTDIQFLLTITEKIKKMAEENNTLYQKNVTLEEQTPENQNVLKKEEEFEGQTADSDESLDIYNSDSEEQRGTKSKKKNGNNELDELEKLVNEQEKMIRKTKKK